MALQGIGVPAVPVDLDGQQLLLVVPFVEGLALVQAFVALQPHQVPVKGRGHDLGHLGFAHTGSALNEQRPAQCQGHIHGGGQGVVINVMGLVHFRFQFGKFHGVPPDFSFEYTIFPARIQEKTDFGHRL